ncbi:MAG: 16S rRNA (uracil(1498)-N(3))-methyltransferase [Rhizobiales bacterium 24-66-13]|jgi:16S rRNA (uracil1498-N3)-methyltransferase|nr:MAG: 16S rRNA (uracil(1498)-N(3))-methyltransferase [Rhizobiales bacterium 12-66-7]OYY84440.1 MAG: 16S rRNA (uracil(1498)-N(3))-methyltransferase [Rhizobiales bacterium 35-66-30]OYZ67552.1 MAG: 16S rRNA (uracil(1498)-N(3))-methyltransferase [Rhizobiales bacterium 24-66-13]OZA98538.1 MAG: 16S rRNA (uracil(1498)-N(3))-methyltransferase [Rhizobiales bacterium 39-66-18]HQS09472.1 16S rRNA (uracil(1498)-N(3))-methyltransferase [Xanthobacteraceae bacterium]
MSDHPSRLQRVFVDEDLSDGAQILLAVEQAHYVANVLRMQVGGSLLLFNGRDGEWLAHRIEGHKREVRFAAERQLRPQPPATDLEYAFAPLKHARLDYMIQKAVEMGAGQLTPVITRYTQVTRVNTERMRANAVEAAEQCGILALPAVREPLALDKWLATLPAERVLVFCDESAALSDPIAALKTAAPGPMSVLIGPEGGFASGERRMLHAHPGVVVLSLGPRILRADTAAVAALTLAQAARGDLAGAGPA